MLLPRSRGRPLQGPAGAPHDRSKRWSAWSIPTCSTRIPTASSPFRAASRPWPACRSSRSWWSSRSNTAATGQSRQQRAADQRHAARQELVRPVPRVQLAAGRLARRARGDQRSLPLQQGGPRHLEARHAEHRTAARRTRWSSTSSACSARPMWSSPRSSTSSIAAWASTTCSSSRWRSSTPTATRCPSPSRRSSTGASCARSSTCGGRTGARCASAFSTTSPKPLAGPEARHLHHARDLRQLRGGGVQRRRLPVRLLRGRRLEAGQRHARFVARDRAPHPPLQFRVQEDPGPSGMPGLRIPVDLPRRLPEVPARPARRLRGPGLLLRGLQNDLCQKRGPLRKELRRLYPSGQTCLSWPWLDRCPSTGAVYVSDLLLATRVFGVLGILAVDLWPAPASLWSDPRAAVRA